MLSLLLGCVVNIGASDCSECNESPQCHSQDTPDGCRCEAQYQWEQPASDGNRTDFECVRIPPRGAGSSCTEPNTELIGEQCYCAEGFAWCTQDPVDLTCCPDDQQAIDTDPEDQSDTGDDSQTEGNLSAGASSGATSSGTAGSGSESSTSAP